jgi:hypothetical protein
MLRKLLSICMMSCLVYVTVPPAFAQQQKQVVPNVQPPGGSPCGTSCTYGGGGPVVPSSVSTSVAQVASNSAITLQNHYAAGTVTASDFASAASAIQSMFANDNETGFTANMQTYILANASLFETNPTQAQLNSAYASVQKLGSTLTLTQFESAFTSSTLSERQAFFSSVQTNGLQYVFGEVVTELQQTAAHYQNNSHGGRLVFAECTNGFSLRVAGLYLGIIGLTIASAGTFLVLAGAIGAVGIGLGIGGEILC